MQARRLLDSPAFFAAGAAVYCLLLLSWLQCGALDAALATLRTCSPLPSVSSPMLSRPTGQMRAAV